LFLCQIIGSRFATPFLIRHQHEYGSQLLGHIVREMEGSARSVMGEFLSAFATWFSLQAAEKDVESDELLAVKNSVLKALNRMAVPDLEKIRWHSGSIRHIWRRIQGP
jgi:hypothetical protein